MAAREDEEANVRKVLAEVSAHCPFGPLFFMERLRSFVRDRCPDPSEGLPLVELHLVSGECFEVCHVIGLAPMWLALAVREPGEGSGMRTEIVPYPAIMRITVRERLAGDGRIGFDTGRVPALWRDEPAGRGPEEALRIAARGGD